MSLECGVCGKGPDEHEGETFCNTSDKATKTLPPQPRTILRDNSLVIVSKCPSCGSPIFGQKSIKAHENPVVKFSCHCRSGDKSILDSMRTS